MVEVGESEEQVDFGDLLLELLLVALDQAADRNDGLHAADPLELRRFQDGLDGFPLCRVDEPARVDEDHVGVGEVGRHDRAVADELAHEPLGVDGRLIAAERDDAQLHPR